MFGEELEIFVLEPLFGGFQDIAVVCLTLAVYCCVGFALFKSMRSSF
jgi:hypothetical protein